ncbi:MAG: ImmA/IrrE family metallo-endopeptidase [Eubacteriales bacterium]|nr:ImmA/IrrE family metallo-endopeptidase [Eubacteriales bacterium]
MKRDYICRKVDYLKKKYKTSDPYEILECMNVEIWEAPSGTSIKGFCFLSNQIFYVSINPELSPQMKRIVAAHELGHIILHKKELKMAMMTDYTFDDLQKDTEIDANLFAVELLLDDSEVAKEAMNEENDYYSLCSKLNIMPSMMAYKLKAMINRGYQYNLPEEINSRCLAKL